MRDTGSLDETKKVINSFITKRNPNYERVGVSVFRGPGYDSKGRKVVYGIETKTLSEYTNDFDYVKNKVSDMNAGGFTPLLFGLNHSLNKMKETANPDARKILIIFTDGHPNIGPKRDYIVDSDIGHLESQIYNGVSSDYTNKYANDIYEKAKIDLDNLDWDSLDDSILDEEQRLYDLIDYYKPAYKWKLSSFNEDLEGKLYENNIHEFLDLAYMIERKSSEIKEAGGEIFTMYLDNSKSDSNTEVINKFGDVEKLFSKISTDEDHYLKADKVIMLPELFNIISEYINKFTYNIEDNIEEGYTLMTDTIKVETPENLNITSKYNDKKISWETVGVDYKELIVSYHISRTKEKKPPVIPVEKYGELIIKHIDIDGNELKSEIKDSKIVGTAYETTKEIFEGFDFVRIADDSAAVIGNYVEGTTKVTYVYKKKEINKIPKTGESNNNTILLWVNIILIAIALIRIYCSKLKKLIKNN